VGTERQNEVRVHHALVDVDHEIGKDPPVVGVVAATHAGGRGVVVRRVRRPQWAHLHAGVAGDCRAVLRVVEDAGQPGVDGVYVIATIEVSSEVDLPV